MAIILLPNCAMLYYVFSGPLSLRAYVPEIKFNKKKIKKMWNFLREHVVNAPSVDSFKNRLDKQWSNEDILYDYKAATPAGRKLCTGWNTRSDHRG